MILWRQLGVSRTGYKDCWMAE